MLFVIKNYAYIGICVKGAIHIYKIDYIAVYTQ